MANAPPVIFYGAMMRRVPAFRKQTRAPPAVGPLEMKGRVDGPSVGEATGFAHRNQKSASIRRLRLRKKFNDSARKQVRLNRHSEFSLNSAGTFAAMRRWMSAQLEDGNEEVWNCFGRAWRDHRCGAVDCECRDRRDQAWWLSW
jgi:hypothetical protein